MKRTLCLISFAVFLIAGVCAARADEAATCTDALTFTETAFVQKVRDDLSARYPNSSDAVAHGYVRYTAADNTGAVSYANTQWNADPAHPSQLFYDQAGHLMGADFSVPRPNDNPRPNLWGIRPCRWFELNGHVHYVLRDASGRTTYDKWVWNRDFVNAGGELSNPSATTLVKLGRATHESDVVTIFEMPTIWDLVVWVTPHSPNPLYW